MKNTIFTRGKRRLRHPEYAAVFQDHGIIEYRVFSSEYGPKASLAWRNRAAEGAAYFVNIYPKAQDWEKPR